MEKFEENLGKFPYVTLADVKDYLNISSDTHNGTLTNAISYATAVVEHTTLVNKFLLTTILKYLMAERQLSMLIGYL